MFLSLAHLRSLLALEQTGSLTAAARQLHLTQSALSHQIKLLESHFDLRLFVRKSRPLQFTPAGQLLLRLAQQTVPQLQAAEQQLKRMASGQAGRLHIVLECHSCFKWLMPALDEFRRHWQEVELDLSQSFSFEPLPALRAGQVDLVIASEAVDDDHLVSEPLFAYESVLIADSSNPLAEKDFVLPAELADQTLICYPVAPWRLDVFNKFLIPAGQQPATLRQTELTPMIIQLVASGRGVAALPAWVLDEYDSSSELHRLRLGKAGVWGALFAVMRRDDRRTSYMEAFLRNALNSCFSLLPGIKPITAESA